MDDNSEEKKTEEFGDPELNNDPITSEPETPIIPAPDPDEPEPAQSYGSVSSSRKRNPKNLLYLVGLIVIVVVLFNVVKTLTGGSKTSSTPTPTPVALESATPNPTESASPEATSTPAPTTNPVDSATGLDRSNLSVAIQNGSGEAGAAGKVSDLLKGLGYDVVSTGNADNFGYSDVTIKVKASQKKYLPLLIKDLSVDYTIGSSSSDLEASSSADALIIKGK